MSGRYFYILLLTLLVSTGFVRGQSQDSMSTVSLNSFYLMPVLNPWLITDNPAGLSQNTSVHPGEMAIGFVNEDGDFKRMLRGQNIQHYRFETKQYKKINKTSLYGFFSYDKSFEKQLRYSEVNDPYRGTPYLLIDTMKMEGNTYDREFLNLNGAFSTPLNKNISWGIGTNFRVGLASQNRDPRPKNKVLNLSVTPGLLFSGSRFRFGLNFIYKYYNEDIESIIVRGNTQMTFFSLHGLGTFIYHVAASYYRLYKQNNLGINTQINYHSGRINSLLGAKLILLKETVVDGRGEGNASWAHIKSCSELRSILLRIYHTTVITNGIFLHQFLIDLNIRQLIGTEIIQRLENDPDHNYMENWVTYGKDEKYGSYLFTSNFNYRFIRLKDNSKPDFTLDGGISYLFSEQDYYIPNQKENYKNLVTSFRFNKSFFFNKSEFSVSAVLRYKRNLSGTLNLEDPNFIVSKIVAPDYEYITQNYTLFGMGMSFEIPIKKSQTKYFINTQASFLRAYDKRTRTYLSVNTGIIF